MRPAHPLEREIGIEWYASDSAGIGGRLKDEPADFRVTELEGIAVEPLDANPGAYPHVVIRATLRGWDTFDFVDRLARELGIHRGAIGWAGTKDKTAVTTQLFSIKGIEADALSDIPHAEFEPIGRLGRDLHYGDLVGNAFDIRVRDATAPDRTPRVTSDLVDFGDGRLTVPNFFGHQRFGSRRPITHRVGLAILSRDWEGAVMTYLGSPSEREPEETRAARTYIEETRDWAGGLERMPGGLGHERRMLSELRESDEDAFRDALEALSERLRELFVHAAQSYLFNRIVSERRDRGLPFTAAVAGDTVCFARSHERLGMIPDLNRTQRVTPDRVETINRHVRNGRAFVAAPLVGTETELGQETADEIVQGVLAEAGVELTDFDLPQPYDSTGTVRPIVVHPDVTAGDGSIRFRFGLPSGAYATVVMREYLKVDPDAMT